MRACLALLLLVLAAPVGAWTISKGYTDAGAPITLWFPAAVQNAQTTVQPVSLWDLFATDPVATTAAGTSITKANLKFDDTNTCTSTSATVGCAFQSFKLPIDFPSAGVINAKIFFTTTSTTNAQTTIFTLSTKCSTPTASNTGAVDNPATLNAAQSLTYTNAAAEVSASLRVVTLAAVTTTGCSGGDFMHVRVGRNISDTSTDATLAFYGLELAIFVGQ